MLLLTLKERFPELLIVIPFNNLTGEESLNLNSLDLDNIVKNFLKEGASKYVNFLGNATIAGGLGFTAEGFTELGTSAGQMLTDKYVYDNDVDFMRDWRQLTDAFIIGGLMGGPVTSVSDFSNRVQQSNNKDFVYNFMSFSNVDN